MREDTLSLPKASTDSSGYLMYASIWLWGIAQTLLLQNWIAGWASIVLFVPMYVLRVSREEQMIEQFGEAYRAYMNRTGRVGPRLRGPPAPRAAAGRGLFDEMLPWPCACTMPQPGHRDALRRARLRAPEAPLRPPKKRVTN